MGRLSTWANPASIRLTCGSAIKISIVYPEQFWYAAGLSGWITSDRGPVCYVVDDSASRDGLGALTKGSSPAPPPRPTAAPLRRGAGAPGRMAGGAPARHPVAFHERDWRSEEYVGGCYRAVPALGAWLRAPDGPAVATGRLRWASSERSPEFYGHIEGAVRSASRVAGRVGAALTAEFVG
ncbi:FAD-dependent oxidoreductase [Micromonospora sp. NPDC047465]|uniref:FAD-dependent oxidoreductase n=1 Tax=Micromonospora sp. NPDC047465 TaxID=3154813 RepID=UPI0033FC8928